MSLGAVVTSIQAGESTLLSPLPQTMEPVTASVGSVPMEVLYAGLVAGFSDLYQVNLVIPSNVQTGSSVPLDLTGAAAQSRPPVNIAIQ